MPADCYRVDIIHYLNPSLIWVEVCDSSVTGDNFAFEQIGIYGIVPFETTIDVETARVVALKCTDWLPAINTILKNLLYRCTEVWFLPTHIDRRATIFDDNIHKYGELMIKNDGKFKKVSKHLVNSGFAELNICAFHSKLSNGELNTDLDFIKTRDVVRQLEKYCSKSTQKKEMEKIVKNQTSVFRLKQDFESELTVSNLEKHNNIMIKKVIENKTNDFELCKNLDEKPLGRAFRRTKQITTEMKSNLLKKKSVSSHEQTTSFDDIKRFLESNSKAKDSHSDCSENNSVQKNYVNNTEDIQSRRIRQINNLHKKKYKIVPKDNCTETFMGVKEDSNETICIEDVSMCEKSKKPARPSKTHNDFVEYDDDTTILRNNSTSLYNTERNNVSTEVKEIKKTSKTRQFFKTNKQDCSFKKMVAFGPPGLNPNNLKADELSIFDDTETKIEQKVVDKEETERHDLYGKEDSEVQIEITNKKNLNDLIKKSVRSCDSHKNESKLTSDSDVTILSSTLQRRLRAHKILKCSDSSVSSSDTSYRDTSSVGENKESFDDEEILDRIDKKYCDVPPKKVNNNVYKVGLNLENNVNPFKNIDSSISVFVDKLVTPVLMVHSKMNKRIEPVFEMRDVYFNSHIRIVLKNMSIEKLMMLETITWSTILRGYSLFMVSPMGSGKTMGYLPAVCRLVSDGGNDVGNSVGPMCIVVCATAKSVTEVERLAKMLLGLKERVLACYAGVDSTHITTTLLNGCDMIISTPPALARLLQLSDFGVDLRRLSIFVLDDCERLTETYSDELKFFQIKINAMLKVRINKELKVQYIIASRVWCDFMEPLAKKAPDTVICIGAFQECVLYSKASTSVSIVKNEKKMDHVFEFLNTIDTSKKTVIVCETNNEVEILEKALKEKYAVFACDNNMTVHDLYNLSESWGDYQEPILGPILVCCDGNLTHMNITDAHYLIHFSLPQLFSMFCKRFAVLTDNYSSIFKSNNENIKIKIILDESNVQQLPKIVNFIKRCTENLPPSLDEVCAKILTEKDSLKAEKYVPLCDNLLTLGICPDFYNCQERHTILKDYDTPKEWVPQSGVITFKIIHYHTATLYSARLLSVSVNGNITKFPQTYSTLSLKMGMYFGRESNRKLHGMPETGDICAAAIKLNFFARCQVLKVLSRYQRGNPNKVLVKLIDEEKYEITRDIYLYYLPDELKEIETKVVQIRLANIEPKDKDITFSDLARNHLNKICDSEGELFMKAQVSLAVGNCIFVTTLEACQELSSMNETIVKCNFKHELLINHAISNLDHLSKIEKLCYESGLNLKQDAKMDEVKVTDIATKNLPKGSWAYLESGEMSVIFFASAINPERFFVRLDKFESCISILLNDIKTYVDNYTEEACGVKEGEIVLAKFPDDATYERARIDNIDGNKVKCFFVDQGDWRDVQINCLVPITEQFINRLPFQAIECRLVGVMPPGKEWTDFSTNWFSDACCEDNNGDLKRLYVNYFTKEPAEFTNGYKYGVVLIDTNTEQDIVINELMIDLNLARENEEEIKYFENLLTKPKEQKESSQADNEEWEQISESDQNSTSRNEVLKPLNTLLQKPLRSIPLVDSDLESEDSDKWDVNINVDTAAELFHKVKKDRTIAPSSIKEKVPNIFPNLKNSITIKTKEMQELDSDDLTSPESTEMLKTPEKQNTLLELDQKRRPKIIWRQNKNTVHVKIQLVVDTYELKIEDRMIDFSAFANDTKYEFDFELFGVINKDKSTHINKGQYILVKLCKVLNKNWLTLTRDGGIKKWIVYDVDFIDTSSDEEVIDKSHFINIVKNIHDNEETESEDDFYDDVNFSYKEH